MFLKILSILGPLISLLSNFFDAKAQESKKIEEKKKEVQKQADTDFKSHVEDTVKVAQGADQAAAEKAKEELRKMLAE